MMWQKILISIFLVEHKLRWYSRGSPGGWFWNLSKFHLKKKDNMILSFDFDLPCWTSFGQCSLGGWSWISLHESCIYKYHWKNYDDWFINGRDIQLFNLLKKKNSKKGYWSLSYNKSNKRLNDLKCQYTQVHFWENCKKKFKSQDP